ncbi:hypothetical protein [Nesterenkonia aurantiaca]|uniref:Antitoxin Xre/MbcA/ParS-like toxin-binding domain-containing protein n=1 Tax=Nesterenkonia aurantiaca TaxID=1436010 RepID=A0A4R7FUI4_9MICC|nr:hypothetical protein [Nesterenkonia aurantiaca]TDS82345.1 hypothetical protein EV640_1152 [Nesterenkonia aurantiaca]
MSEAVRTHSVAEFPVRDVSGIVRELMVVFGTSLLSFIMEVDSRSLQRWSGGQGIRYESEKRVRDLHTVFTLLRQKEEPATIRAWFMGMNPQLDDASPAEAIRDGSARDVMAAARAYLNAA